MTAIPETNEILRTGLSTDRPYLGSPKVVDGILREYLSDLTKLRTAQIERGEDPIPGLKELARVLQTVFYGVDARYLPFHWNNEKRLGEYLVNGCGIGGSTSDAVYRLAVRMAKEYFTDLVAHERGGLDEAGLQASIDELLRKYTAILCGAGDVSEHG